MNNMNMNIMGKKCSICNTNNTKNSNLNFMTYNKSPFRLYFHQECKNKLLNFLVLIFKNQALQINMDKLEYGDIHNIHNINNMYDISRMNQHKLSKLITTKFLCFTKVYNIMELINQIQLNDPLYHILLIVSTWFDYQ
jgi:hypothetical protein